MEFVCGRFHSKLLQSASASPLFSTDVDLNYSRLMKSSLVCVYKDFAPPVQLDTLQVLSEIVQKRDDVLRVSFLYLCNVC